MNSHQGALYQHSNSGSSVFLRGRWTHPENPLPQSSFPDVHPRVFGLAFQVFDFCRHS